MLSTSGSTGRVMLEPKAAFLRNMKDFKTNKKGGQRPPFLTSKYRTNYCC